MNYIDKDKQNIELLKLAIKNNLQTIQFCYSTLYPKIYARTNAFGIQNKAKFDFVYSKWKKKCAIVYSNTYSKWTTVYSSAYPTRKKMLVIIKIVFRILQNKNQLKLLILQMWMVNSNQKHLKNELQFYLMKSLFKKNKIKLQKKIIS